MNPLIAVMTCRANSRCADAQRATWAKASPIPVRFFIGQAKSPAFARRPLSDEIFLDCPDDYLNLPRKVQLAVYWARVNGFNGVFKCDDDVYLRPERVRFTSDYSGNLYAPKAGYPKGFCHGGAGYWLSQRAMDVVIVTPIPRGELSEDGFVANALAVQGITGKNDLRVTYTRRVQGDPMPETPWKDNLMISAAEFSASEMFKVHRAWSGVDTTDTMSADDYKRELKRAGQWRAL